MPVIRPDKDALRWTPKSREFVKKFRLYGAGISLKQFCRAYKFSYHAYIRWRKAIPGFASEVDAVKTWHTNQGDRLFSQEAEEEALVEGGLTRKEANFVAHFRETYDRVDAMKLVKWRAEDYEAALQHDEFSRAVRSIEKEIHMKIEDSLRSQAIDGSVGAIRKHLEAEDPEKYTKQVKVKHDVTVTPSAEGVRQATRLWGERFGVFQDDEPKALPEVIDV